MVESSDYMEHINRLEVHVQYLRDWVKRISYELESLGEGLNSIDIEISKMKSQE